MAFHLLSPTAVDTLLRTRPRRNLVPYTEGASQWTIVGASVTPRGLDALGQLPRYALASDGSQWHRATNTELPVEAVETYSARLIYRPGTSGAMRITCRYVDATTTSNSLLGTPGSLPTFA